MSADNPKRAMMPVSFGANNIVQLLSAGACFLAAFVIPANYPELAGTQYIFIGLGIVVLVAAVLSIVFHRWISRVYQRIGLRSRMLLPREGMVYLGDRRGCFDRRQSRHRQHAAAGVWNDGWPVRAERLGGRRDAGSSANSKDSPVDGSGRRIFQRGDSPSKRQAFSLLPSC